MESFTLYQVNEYIRRVIALNFREPIWVEAEIIQVKESRGNYYLELIEKKEGSDEIIAQASAAIWYRNYMFIRKKLGTVVQDLLVNGTQVRLKCRVDFHERYGLKLLIEDIDPRYTFGQLEIRRQEIIQRLQKEGLMDLNKGILLPDVIQKIAVISSDKAAGFKDFMSHLKTNPYGYTFHTRLFQAAVQGTKVEKETCDAIQSILKGKESFHAVIILRGGGSKLDLAAYDNFNIAKSIAQSDIPFMIGIGHDVDSTVVDLVANLSLKTPTAVADYLIEHNAQFESAIESEAQQVFHSSLTACHQARVRLQALAEHMELTSGHFLTAEWVKIDQINNSIRAELKHYLSLSMANLEKIRWKISSLDPETILKKGYAYLIKDGKQIRKVVHLTHDDEVTIFMQDGSVASKIL